MKRNNIDVLTICALLALLVTFSTSFGQTPAPQSFAAFDQGAYTPAKASAERKAILDAYRAARKQPGEDATKEIVFVVGYMKMHRGWAWITVTPQSPGGDQQYESESALLHKENGQWKVKARQSSEEGDEDNDDKQFFRKLKKRFPSMPPDILPR